MKNVPHINLRSFKGMFAVTLFMFSVASFIHAQTVYKLDVSIAMKVKGGDLKNALVTVTRKNEPFKILDPSKGETTIEVPLGYEYLFTFTKLGYITQYIVIDTHVPENRELKPFKKQDFKVELQRESNKDLAEKIKLAYNMNLADFDFIKGPAPKIDKNLKKENIATTPINKTTTAKIDSTANSSRVTKKGDKIKDKKVIQQDSKRITLITISIDEKDYIYKKEEYSWGGVFYYKNDISITGDTFLTETEE
ncbi:MAG: hypothetical protein WBM13_11530 [Bacteroidia bacterium]